MEEFSVFRSDLLKELELVQGAIEKKASVPVLSNVQDQSQSRSANQVVDQGWMNGIEPSGYSVDSSNPTGWGHRT